MLIPVNPDNPQPRRIQQAAEALRAGALVCYPTDTVYGIGCDLFHQKAIKRLYQLKRRPQDKPFSFMCASLKDASTYSHISNTAYRIMKRCLPGPYTFILPAMKVVPKIMMTKQKTVGIRVPDNVVCQALLEALGNPLVTTSAVLAEENPLGEAYEVEERWDKQVDMVVDGGPVYPAPSTVISLVGETPEILRQGKGKVELF